MTDAELNKLFHDINKVDFSDEKSRYIEKKKQECFINKPLNTYEDCWHDVQKWFVFDPTLSHCSYIIFQQFKNDFNKYPIEYQMKLLIEIYINGIHGTKQKAFNTVLRKIYKSESKEFKDERTKGIREHLNFLNLIKVSNTGTEYVEVYRGANCKSAPNDIAISWTHNIDVAKCFANRFAILHQGDKCCKVYKGKIKVTDIIDVDNEEENEIITFPRKVYDIEEIKDFVADYNGTNSITQAS